MLSAGTNVEWLRDDLGIIDTRRAEPRRRAAGATPPTASSTCPPCSASARPSWDYGARGTLLGLTRGSERPQIVRAVLEGVAQRGVDLVEAAEADAGLTIPTLRVDGGMSDNPTFVQALADATAAPGRGVTRDARPPRSAPRSSPASPSAPGPAGTTSPPPGARGDASSPAARSTASAGALRPRPRRGWYPELSSLSF